MKVLIADDQPVTLKRLTAMVTKWNYEAVAVSNGDEAWKILQSLDAPRLAVVDCQMPGYTGDEICRLARLHLPDQPLHIILLTAMPDLILPTIKSRCQILQFTPVGKTDIERVLVEKGYPDERARIISLFVRGNLEEALALDWDEIQEKRREAWDIFLSFLGKKEASTFLKNYSFGKRSMIRDDLERTMEILASFCRDFILLKEKGEPSLLLNPDYKNDIESLTGDWSLDNSRECLNRVESVLSGLSKNLNISLLIGSFYSLIGETRHA